MLCYGQSIAGSATGYRPDTAVTATPNHAEHRVTTRCIYLRLASVMTAVSQSAFLCRSQAILLMQECSHNKSSCQQQPPPPRNKTNQPAKKQNSVRTQLAHSDLRLPDCGQITCACTSVSPNLSPRLRCSHPSLH